MEPSQCNECGEQTSTQYCVECNVQLCKECCGVIHSLKKRKDHKIMDVLEYLTQKSQQLQEAPVRNF